jgi:hypothetical protein
MNHLWIFFLMANLLTVTSIAQKTTIDNVRVSLDEKNHLITVTYNLLSKSSSDSIGVRFFLNNREVKAYSVSGAFGIDVEVGVDKTIRWEYKNDKIQGKGSLEAEVYAEKKPLIHRKKQSNQNETERNPDFDFLINNSYITSDRNHLVQSRDFGLSIELTKKKAVAAVLLRGISGNQSPVKNPLIPFETQFENKQWITNFFEKDYLLYLDQIELHEVIRIQNGYRVSINAKVNYQLLTQRLLDDGVLKTRKLFSQIGIIPKLMIIPADDLLKRLNCLAENTIQGQRIVERDYLKAYTDLIDLRFVSGAIAQRFVDVGFPPLEDLEQSLKNLENSKAMSQVNDVQTDAVTEILNQVRPDIILELSYQLQESRIANRLTFSLVAKDAYTSKILATISNPGMQTAETDVPTMLSEQVENNLNNFTAALAKHAEDVQANGRTIRLLISVDGNAGFDLEDNCGTTGEAYIDVLMDIVEKHKKKESETPNPGNGTTGKRMEITNIRIDFIDPIKNRGLSARDWTRFVLNDIQKACGVKAKNVSQGLADGRIIMGR